MFFLPVLNKTPQAGPERVARKKRKRVVEQTQNEWLKRAGDDDEEVGV